MPTRSHSRCGLHPANELRDESNLRSFFLVAAESRPLCCQRWQLKSPRPPQSTASVAASTRAKLRFHPSLLNLQPQLHQPADGFRAAGLIGLAGGPGIHVGNELVRQTDASPRIGAGSRPAWARAFSAHGFGPATAGLNLGACSWSAALRTGRLASSTTICSLTVMTTHSSSLAPPLRLARPVSQGTRIS
jgi:hypothetical protein